MNHKRRRPKNRRAGCLLCKPHKANGRAHMTIAERRVLESEREWVSKLAGYCG